ncbi:MAG: FHA domain-containing protein [Elainellaceae cyanobacterium]
MLFNLNFNQLDDALLHILKQNPALSNSLLADGTRTAKNVTQIMAPVLSAHSRCQVTKYYIQAVSIDREIFLTTNLSGGAKIYATHAASSWLIGRGATCAISVPEPSVSRRHAVIGHHVPEGFFITDLGSSNGTRIDQLPLAAGTRQGLKDGTLIQMGDLKLEFFTACQTDLDQAVPADEHITAAGNPQSFEL